MSDGREILWLWSAMVLGIANGRIWGLSANYDSIDMFCQAVGEHSVSGVTQAEYDRADKISYEDAEKILTECDNLGIKYYCYESEGYPSQLRRIAAPPAVLFFKGNLDFLNDKCIITVVGTRKPSDYSLKITDKICSELIDRGFLLAGGFAEGIDSRVNNVSLEKGNFPIAVCGTSLDHDYPKGSGEFKEKIAQNGVVISEYYPGCRGINNPFVYRNRILTGLSSGVLFIEASRDSHGLDNYNHAIYQGKPVFVIPPHDIYDKRYFGQRDLLRNECQAVFDVQDIVRGVADEQFGGVRFTESRGSFQLPSGDSGFFEEEDFQKKKPRRKKVQSKSEKASVEKEIDFSKLNETQREICEFLKQRDMLADEISVKTGLEISEVLSVLTELELEGYVRSLPGKLFGL